MLIFNLFVVFKIILIPNYGVFIFRIHMLQQFVNICLLLKYSCFVKTVYPINIELKRNSTKILIIDILYKLIQFNCKCIFYQFGQPVYPIVFGSINCKTR